jgi:retron-type reverse transcriptase
MTTKDTTNKPFQIDKRRVYEAYKAVKSNGGAAGVDRQTIEQFEANLGSNLYKIWNRMSSGSYVGHKVRASQFLIKIAGDHAHLFVHWRLGMTGTFI